MEFLSIAQTAKAEKLPATALRRMLKQGTLPGFYAGNRFYVNVERLRQQLDVSNG